MNVLAMELPFKTHYMLITSNENNLESSSTGSISCARTYLQWKSPCKTHYLDQAVTTEPTSNRNLLVKLSNWVR